MLVVENITVCAGEESRVIVSGFNVRVDKGEIVFIVGEDCSALRTCFATEQKIQLNDFIPSLIHCEIIFGPSGAGKSLLLRALAALDGVKAGRLLLDGKSPHEFGIPGAQEVMAAGNAGLAWRAEVCYVSQTRWAFTGSPADTFAQAKEFAAQRGRRHSDLDVHAAALGLDTAVLAQSWSTLSGGQAQRCQIAIAVALGPAVLLLDEPTSALDQESVGLVEGHLKQTGCAIVWISHDPAQPGRVGGRIIQLPLSGERGAEAV